MNEQLQGHKRQGHTNTVHNFITLAAQLGTNTLHYMCWSCIQEAKPNCSPILGQTHKICQLTQHSAQHTDSIYRSLFLKPSFHFNNIPF